MERIISVLGLGVLVGIAVVFSTDRRRIDWKLVGIGLVLQVIFAAFVHLFPPGQTILGWVRDGAVTLLSYTEDGSRFLFGPLMEADGPAGFVFAFRVLPVIIFFSALMGVLYHLGFMQRLVLFLARGMKKAMGVSGAESLATAANVFIGQTEAPLVVRPYISSMTRAEMMVMMTGGMATIAGSVLAGYIAFGIDAGHLLAASVMSAPAALVMARVLVPETEVSRTAGSVEISDERETVNVIDAAADGASQGLKLALNVGAMLLAFIALVALVNALLGVLAGWMVSLGLTGWPASLQEIFGYLLWPVAWSLGVPSADCFTFAGLLGQKLAINEFVAYAELGAVVADSGMSERAITIATYSLCGFANFSSISIQIGGIGALAPERRQDLSRLGLRAMLGGALASSMTGAIAGIMPLAATASGVAECSGPDLAAPAPSGGSCLAASHDGASGWEAWASRLLCSGDRTLASPAGVSRHDLPSAHRRRSSHLPASADRRGTRAGIPRRRGRRKRGRRHRSVQAAPSGDRDPRSAHDGRRRWSGALRPDPRSRRQHAPRRVRQFPRGRGTRSGLSARRRSMPAQALPHGRGRAFVRALESGIAAGHGLSVYCT